MRRKQLKLTLLVGFMIIPLVTAQVKMPSSDSRKVDYEHDIRPLLSQNCYSCHGVEVQQAGLRLDLRQNALRGGDYGPVIKIGDSGASKLVRRLLDGDGGMQMPPTGPLSKDEIALIRAWIDQGAEFRTDVDFEPPRKVVDAKVVALIDAVRSADRGEILKQISADPKLIAARDTAGSTLLHHAAGFGPLANLQLLIERGADVTAKNRRGSTPLHWAMYDSSKVRLLLSKGANVNQQQSQGRSPLFLAAMLGNGVQTLQLLLTNGADPNLAATNGQTPLIMAALRGNMDSLKLLIDHGADVNHKDGAGETALMSACTSKNLLAVKYLIEKGADVKAKSKRDETALGFAATSGVQASVDILLANGAEVNVRNFRGYSPLMFAASSDALPAGAVRSLLRNGADTTFTGDYDEPAQSLAAKHGNSEVARILQAGFALPTSDIGPQNMRTDVSKRSIPLAVSNSLRLLETQSDNFIRIAGCNSCHSQNLPSAAAGFATDRGLRLRKPFPELPETMLPSAEQIMDFIVISPGSAGWDLFDRGMSHKPRTQVSDALVHYILAIQNADGGWTAPQSRRPPMNTGEFQTAALAIYSLKNFAPVAAEDACRVASEKAAMWLVRNKPLTNQDHAFRLLGLIWGGAPIGEIRREVRTLAALQKSDGGWSQLHDMTSDAYATGQAMYALGLAGETSERNSGYRRGLQYLLTNQANDGSWLVKTRAIWFQPYLETGFPYGKDQFISTAGTAWATLALTQALQENPNAAH